MEAKTKWLNDNYKELNKNFWCTHRTMSCLNTAKSTNWSTPLYIFWKSFYLQVYTTKKTEETILHFKQLNEKCSKISGILFKHRAKSTYWSIPLYIFWRSFYLQVYTTKKILHFKQLNEKCSKISGIYLFTIYL